MPSSSAVLRNLKPMAFVATADASRAIPFYRDLLGLPLTQEDDFAATFDLGGTPLRLQKVERLTPAPFTALGWSAPDIAPIVKKLMAAGVAFERYPWMTQTPEGIWDAPDGGRVAWFKDPDGNLLSISQE